MTIAEILSALDGKSVLEADDALALRRAVYGTKLQVTPTEADAVFKLNADAGQVSSEWHAFFVEAMTDFVVRQQDPAGYIDESKAQWLIASVCPDPRIREDELDMLIHVLEEAQSAPAKLSAFVLHLVKGAALSALEKEGRLVTDHVERLRRVLFAVGGDGNIGVTRHEAETLFDINDALKGKSADPAWSEFFAHAVGSAVLRQSTWTPDAIGEVHRQTWLADTQPHVLAQFRSLTDLDADEAAISEGFRDVTHWNSVDDGMGQLVAKQDEVERDAERVTPDEAHWLLARIGRNGQLDANEQALMAFLRANASTLDPSLDDLVAQSVPQ